MGDVDIPDQKRKLWMAMRADLVNLVPAFEDLDTLLCPICCRALSYDKFSLEHILPQQAVKHDPRDVQAAVVKNARSGLTLLCKETLTVGSKPYSHGCNGWKGRNFDSPIAKMLTAELMPRGMSDTHIISLLMVGYLGLFKHHGYRVALTPAGLTLRNQFFNPRKFTPNLPLTSQMVLKAPARTTFSPEAHAYWSEPVKVYVEGLRATVVIRNYSAIIQLSRDPADPIAKQLAYVPSKYVFRPDLRLAFS